MLNNYIISTNYLTYSQINPEQTKVIKFKSTYKNKDYAKVIHTNLKSQLEQNWLPYMYTSKTANALAIEKIVNNMYGADKIYNLTSFSHEIICNTLIYTAGNKKNLPLSIISNLWEDMYKSIEQANVYDACYKMVCIISSNN